MIDNRDKCCFITCFKHFYSLLECKPFNHWAAYILVLSTSKNMSDICCGHINIIWIKQVYQLYGFDFKRDLINYVHIIAQILYSRNQSYTCLKWFNFVILFCLLPNFCAYDAYRIRSELIFETMQFENYASVLCIYAIGNRSVW